MVIIIYQVYRYTYLLNKNNKLAFNKNLYTFIYLIMYLVGKAQTLKYKQQQSLDYLQSH